jgi:hypothetical protein
MGRPEMELFIFCGVYSNNANLPLGKTYDSAD